jgi:hypothetical protein
MFDVRRDTPVIKMHYRRSGSYYYVQPFVRSDNLTWYGGTSYAINQSVPHAIEISWSAASAPGANNGAFEFRVDGTLSYSKTNLDNDTHRIDQAFLKAMGQVGYQSTYCYDAFESRSDSAIGLLNGVHGCGSSQEFWEPLSASAMLPIIPFTGTLEISGTIATITTTLPVTLTNLEQSGRNHNYHLHRDGDHHRDDLATSHLGHRLADGATELEQGPRARRWSWISTIYTIPYRLTDAVYTAANASSSPTTRWATRTQMVSRCPGQVLTTTYGYDIAKSFGERG